MTENVNDAPLFVSGIGWCRAVADRPYYSSSLSADNADNVQRYPPHRPAPTGNGVLMITNLIDQLRRDEGEVLHAYQDKYGYWTIGVGRLIDSRKGGAISKAESALLLANDIQSCEQAIAKTLPWASNLDPIRRAVLTNMAFNMGADGLFKFKNTLMMVQDHNFLTAAKAMLESKWAKQLPERAARLAEQMKSGEWQ